MFYHTKVEYANLYITDVVHFLNNMTIRNSHEDMTKCQLQTLNWL